MGGFCTSLYFMYRDRTNGKDTGGEYIAVSGRWAGADFFNTQ